jgi:hypothetical protein
MGIGVVGVGDVGSKPLDCVWADWDLAEWDENLGAGAAATLNRGAAFVATVSAVGCCQPVAFLTTSTARSTAR